MAMIIGFLMICAGVSLLIAIWGAIKFSGWTGAWFEQDGIRQGLKAAREAKKCTY